MGAAAGAKLVDFHPPRIVAPILFADVIPFFTLRASQRDV
jgi:hypothetical protein